MSINLSKSVTHFTFKSMLGKMEHNICMYLPFWLQTLSNCDLVIDNQRLFLIPTTLVYYIMVNLKISKFF